MNRPIDPHDAAPESGERIRHCGITSAAPLFSAPGLADLQSTMRPGVLCVFDFDGTLAPIVAEPDRAALPVAIRDRLLRLQMLTPVAILTGRSIGDIGQRLAFAPDYLVGNHGLEGLPDSAARREEFADLCAGWRQAIDAALADGRRFDPAIGIEDKAISLSLHYRQVKDAVASAAALRLLLATLSPPPRIIAGKCVFNLLPQDAGDKGTAFIELMRLAKAKKALYVGDDVTDEDVFTLRRGDVLSIRIGESDGSAAPYFLRRYHDVALLLDTMIIDLQVAATSTRSAQWGT